MYSKIAIEAAEADDPYAGVEDVVKKLKAVDEALSRLYRTAHSSGSGALFQPIQRMSKNVTEALADAGRVTALLDHSKSLQEPAK
jgi:hypothetical protein